MTEREKRQLVVKIVKNAIYRDYDCDEVDVITDEKNELVVMYHSDTNSFPIKETGVKANEVDLILLEADLDELYVGHSW